MSSEADKRYDWLIQKGQKTKTTPEMSMRAVSGVARRTAVTRVTQKPKAENLREIPGLNRGLPGTP